MSEVRILEPRALTAEAFAPFGDVIDEAAACERFAINEGHTQRHHDLGRIDCSGGDGRAALSLFRATPIDAGFQLRFMERHPLGSQAFINTSGCRYAVVVAPRGELDEAAIEAFVAEGNQSLNYHRGTWHHYLLALDAPADFVIVDRVGPGDNCEERQLSAPLLIHAGQ
ncbi:MAG: ureidoglycolate lyase [Pseudomonadota bacterium]